MHAFFKSILGSKATTFRRPDPRRVRLQTEPLERRELMSAGIDFNPATGVVSIYGSDQDDVATVTAAYRQVKVALTCYSDAPPNLSFFSDSKSFQAARRK